MPPPVVQLSCELCTTRKIKCDKGNPCSACQRAKVSCQPVSRKRLARGRKGGRKSTDANLSARLQRLESLVKTFGGSPPAQDSTSSGSPDQLGAPAKTERSASERYIGGSFWSALSNEVQGIRDILDHASGDEDESSPQESNSSPNTPHQSQFSFILCASGTFMCEPGILAHPPHHIVKQIVTLYLERVDPMVKVLHSSWVYDALQEKASGTVFTEDDPASNALVFAVYYSAINSAEDATCLQLLGSKKADILTRFRFATEVSLSKANFVTTKDIRVLQALVILIAAVRTTDNSRWSWTMISLAARIARALSLRSESIVSTFPPYESQLRRRLWHNICIMDVQFAFDRAVEPMIDESTYTTLPPANVTDIRLPTGDYGFTPEQSGFASTSFLLMQIEASSMACSLNFFSDDDGFRRSHQADRDWRRRMDKVEGYKKGMYDRYGKALDLNIPFQRWMRAVLDITTTVMLLVALRPMQRHPDVPPPNIESIKVLRIAVSVLEKSVVLGADDAFAPWRWFLWVQWHSLAVAIAELCVKDHGGYADGVWPVVDGAYEYLARDIADSERGLLWRPIVKLMRKARSLRGEFLAERAGGGGVVQQLQHQQPEAQSYQQQQHTKPHTTNAPTLPPFSTPSNTTPPTNYPTPSTFQPTSSTWLDSSAALQQNSPQLPSLSQAAAQQYQDWSFDQYALEDMNLQTVTWPSDQTTTAWTQWNVFMNEFGEVG